MPVALEAGETRPTPPRPNNAARRREAAARRRAEAERKRQERVETRARAAAMRELHRISRRVEREERNLPVGTTGPKKGKRWDQRQAERDTVEGASFGSAITESATEKKKRRKAEAAERRRRRTLSPSRGFAEAQVSRVAERGKLTGETGFYEWAKEEGRFNPSFDEYLKFVANRRDIEKTGGQSRLAARSRREATSGLTEGRRLEGQAGVGVDRSLQGRELSPDVDAPSFGSGMYGRSFEPRDTGGPLEFFTETIPGLVAGAFPGAGDVTGQMRLGNNPVSIVPDAGPQGTPAAALASAGAESALRDTVTQTASMAGLPGLAAAQLAEGFLYTPAFVYMMATDPVGTSKAVYESAKYAVEHPTERPGDLAALAWGVLGGTLGIAGRFGATSRLGAPGRAAARFTGADLAPGLRTTLTERLPAGQGRHAARERALEAEIESAPASALASRSRTLRQEIAIDRPRRVTPPERRHLVDTQSEAIRAVMDQTTPRERIAGYQRALLEAKTPGARRRLQRLIRANAEVLKRELVEGDPGDIRISPRHERLVELARQTIASSRRQERTKKTAGVLTEETAQARLAKPGQMFRGGDYFDAPKAKRLAAGYNADIRMIEQRIAELERVRERLRSAPGEWQRTADSRHRRALAEYRRGDRRIDKLEPQVARAHEIHGRLLAEQAVLDELLRSAETTPGALARGVERVTVDAGTGTHPRLTFGFGDVGPELAASVTRQRATVASLSRQYERAASAFQPFHDARAARYEAMESLAWTQDQVAAARRSHAEVLREADADITEMRTTLEATKREQSEVAAKRGFEGGEGPSGIAYGPYKADIEPLRGVLPPSIMNKIGRPQSPAMHEFKGGSIASGRVGNVVKLTAQEELKTLRHQERVGAWRQAKKESVTGKEMLRLLDAGEIKLKDIRGVRVRAGTSHIATNQVLSALFRKGDEKLSIFDVATREFGSRDELNMLVREADATGQVRFFDNRKVGLREIRLGQGRFQRGALAVVDTVNNLAKFSLLFLGGPAYLTGNLIGQMFMATAHSIRLPPEVAAVFANVHKIKRTLTREEIAVMRATEGKGISRIITDQRGPIGKLGQLNRGIADAYGKILDDAWRDAAFFLEARKRGYKTPEDVKRLLAGSRSSKERGDLLAIHESVGDAFGAFDKMTQAERQVLTRIFFFYPWLRASLEYSAKFPARRPLTTAALVQGGTFAHDKAQTDLIEEFMGQGLGEDEARIAAEFIMREVPGIFLTDGGDAITPISAAVMSMPGEIFHALPNLFDEPVQELLRFSSTPASELLGASLGYDVFRGGGYPDDETFAGRLLDAVSGFSRDVTLARRLTGDQGAMYTYTTGQAIGQRTAGSIGTRGLNAEGIYEIAERESDEPAEPAPPPKYAKVYQWATVEGNLPNATPEARADIDLWKQGQDLYNYGRRTLARQIGLENKDGSPSVERVEANRRIKYALRSGVLDMIRPGYLRDDWRTYFKKVYDSKNKDAIEEWERGVNAALTFKDKYGRSLEGQLEKLMEAPADDIPGAR